MASALTYGLQEKDLIRLNLRDIPVVVKRPVIRPTDAAADVPTPDDIWVIPSAQNSRTSEFLPMADSELMIRQEYHNLLCAILGSLRRQRSAAFQKRDFPPEEDDAMKVDDVGEGVEPGHLYISEHPTDIFEATSFPNPFENSPNRRLCRYGSGIIITGLPGIGKTVFLVVIFYLRVAAGLPTAYMQSASLILIYDGVHLFVLRKPVLARVAIPPDAWILVDSNIHFMFPPREVAVSNRFIIQASSRQDRTAWAEKDLRGPYQFCLMRPWSLGELFAGASLQSEMCPGPQIQAFYDCFGGSAQHIYQDSKNLDRFDHRVNESASKLDNKMIHHVTTTDSPTVAIDDSVGHMLVTALPLDDRDRTQFRLTSPTPYLEEKLLIRINVNIELARRELYIINVAIPTPGSKAAAADLLDRHHRAFIALGGKWRLREFVKVQKADPAAKANLWRADGDSSMYLVADGKMSIRSNAKASTSRIRTRSTNPTDFQQLTTVNFPTQNGVQLLSHHYYRPIDHSFATFDSFYLDTPTHAITFQASEGDRPHSVKPGGRTWMKERGTKKFTYIYVSGPKAATPSITVPQNAVGDFDKFYHLILEYPELEKLLRSSS